jgi:hypothetical protein
VSSIDQTYRGLKILIRNWRPSVNGSNLEMRFNGDANTRYSNNRDYQSAAVTFGNTFIIIGGGISNTTTQNFAVFDIFDYANATHWQLANGAMLMSDFGTPANAQMDGINGGYNQSAAITSITFLTSGANHSAGTYFIYGVN